MFFMIFKCDKSALQSACQICARAAASKSPITALEGLLLEVKGTRIQVTGYDLRKGIYTRIDGEIEEPGKTVVNARLLCEMIRRMPDGIISVKADENDNITIKCGRTQFNIKGLDASDYPEMPEIDEIGSAVIPQNLLKSMIDQTIFAVSDNDARPIYTGTLFEMDGENLTLVSVDGYRLAKRTENISGANMEKNSFVVPGYALSDIVKICDDDEKKTAAISVGAKQISFSLGDTVIITRRLEGEFLNYRNSIPKVGKYTIDADRRAVIDAVERVSLIISDKLKSPVRCVFSDGVLKVSTTTTLGRAYDECPITGDGEELEIGFNNRYILDALRAIQATNIRMQLSTGISPCVIVPADGSKNFIYMVLPVRLRANEG